MYRWFAFFVAVTIALVVGLSIWGLSGLTHHAIVAIDRYGDAAPRAHAIDPVIQNVATATGDWSAASKAQASSVSAIERDLRVELWHVDRVMTSADQVAAGLKDDIGALHKTVDATTDLTVALTTDAQTANQTIAAGKPLLEASTLAVQHFDVLIGSKSLSDALAHVDGMTSSGDAILADARKVADKETADWLKPVPWWKQPISKGGELIDIGAAVARHAP